MNNLIKHKLDTLYEMSSGISSTPDQAGHGSPFLSFSSVFNNFFLPEELSDKMKISEQESKSLSINEGDVFLTRTSETIDELGISSVALKDYPKSSFSGFLKRLRPIDKEKVMTKGSLLRIVNVIIPIAIILLMGLIMYFIRKMKYSK